MEQHSLALRVALLAAAAVLGLAAVAAEVRADSRWLVMAGTFLVGMSFVVAAVFSPLGGRVRWLTALPGLLWWLGALVPSLGQAYVFGLVLLLVSFPGYRPSAWGWLPVAGALPAWAGVMDRWMVAAILAAAVPVVVAAQRPRPAQVWASSSAAAVATLLGAAFALDVLAPGSIHPRLVLELLMLCLVAVALTSLLAAREVLAAADRSAVLALEQAGAGLPGLRDVLRAATGDPTLQVVVPSDATVPQAAGRAVVPVTYAPGRTAYLLHRATTLADPAVMRVVQNAVVLTARNLDARAELARQARVAADARARAVSARDRQRREVAQRLSTDVVPQLDAALDVLATDSGAGVELVREAVAAALAEVMETVAGIAPAELGRGGLVGAVRERTAAYDVPVTVDTTAWQGADPETEETLFYVCSEAVVNAVKHSGALRITVSLRSQGEEAVAIVADDGRGGADPVGHGLTGLADRVAARGGRLRVESPPGAGTAVTAVLPVSRSSSTG